MSTAISGRFAKEATIMPTSVRLSSSVERGLEYLEDYYLAAYESKLLRKGEAQAVSLDEMRHRLGLEG